MSKGFIESYGPKLVDNGYEIFPVVQKNKTPAIKGWRTAKPALSTWASNLPAKTGIGIRTDHNPVIDMDIKDVEVIRKLVSHVADTFFMPKNDLLIRVGQAPKIAILCKTSNPFQKIKSKIFRDPNGDTHHLEILGAGRYFVSMGIHPKTEKLFTWIGKSPLEFKRDAPEIPELTEQTAKDFIDYFESIVPDAWEVVEYENSEGHNQHIGEDILLNFKPPLDVSEEEIKELLENIDPDIDHDHWVMVGMGLYHQFNGGHEGFELWDDWSKKGDKYNELIMLTKWESFAFDPSKTNPITLASVYHLAEEEIEEEILIPGQSKPFFIPLAEIAKKAGSAKFLIKNWIETGTVSSIFGDPGSFKSFVAIDMACHIATGLPWMGNDVEKGNVVYLAGEGFGGLGRRTLAWCLHRKMKPEDVPVFFSQCPADLYDKKSAKALSNHLDSLFNDVGDIKAVFIDTLARNMGSGDENSTSDMNQFISHIDRYIKDKYGCSVVIIHHTGHKDKHRARGASSLLGALDHNIRCEKTSKLNAMLSATKMKDAEEPDALAIQAEVVFIGLDDDGEPMASLAFDKSEIIHTEEVKELTGRQKEIMETIKRLSVAGEATNIERVDLYRKLENDGVYKEGRRAAPIIERLIISGHLNGNETTVRLNLSVCD